MFPTTTESYFVSNNFGGKIIKVFNKKESILDKISVKCANDDDDDDDNYLKPHS